MPIFGWLNKSCGKACCKGRERLDDREENLDSRERGIKERGIELSAKESTQVLVDDERLEREKIQSEHATGMADMKREIAILDIQVEHKKKLKEELKDQHAEILKFSQEKYQGIIAEKDNTIETLGEIVKVMAAKIPEINLNNISVIPTLPKKDKE